MPTLLKPELLQTFVAIAESGSFTGVARLQALEAPILDSFRAPLAPGIAA